MTSPTESADELPRPVLPSLHSDIHHKSMQDLMLGMSFGRPPEILSSEPGRRQLMVMVRLMDKTVIEYRGMRQQCEEWTHGINDPTVGAQFTHYFRAIDQLENCVGALHRTLLHLNRIRTMPATSPIDRTAHKALGAAIDEINALRDTIEHADERLLQAEPGAPSPVVFLHHDRVQIGTDDSIIYSYLAQWIYQTFRLVRAVIEKVSSPSSASTSQP